MTTFVNVGAFVNGQRPASKKVLKAALAVDPSSVTFDKTAVLFDAAGIYTASSLPNDISLSVCGPDPKTSRRWFATVSRGIRGLKVT